MKSPLRRSSTAKHVSRPPRKKALLLGVCSSKDSSEDGSSISTLNGPLDDVSRVKALITEKYNYPEENICALVEDSEDLRLLPTRENIIRELHALVHDAQSGDRLLFVYAGHGAQADQDPNELTREPDGKNEGILPSDANFADTQSWILDDELHKILVKPLPPDCRLTAIFDCCHSGTALDLLHYECNRIFVPWLFRRRTSAYTLFMPSRKNTTTKFTTAQTVTSIVTASSSTDPSTTTSSTRPSRSTTTTHINARRDSACVVFCNNDVGGSMRKLTREIKQNHVCREVLTKSDVSKMKGSEDGKGTSRKWTRSKRGAELDITTITSETSVETKTIMSAITSISNRSQRSISSSFKNFFSSRSQSRQNSSSTTRSGSPSVHGPGSTHRFSAASTFMSFASNSTVASGRSTDTKRSGQEKEKCTCCDFALKYHRHRAYRRIPNEFRTMIQQLRERSLGQKAVPEEVEVTRESAPGRSRATSFVAAPTIGLAASIPGVVAQVNPMALNRGLSANSESTTPGSSRVPTCTCNCHFRSTRRRDAPSPPPLSASPEPSSPRDLPEKSILINSSSNSNTTTTHHAPINALNTTRPRLRVRAGSILIPNSPYHSAKDEISRDFRQSWGTATATSILGDGESPIPRTTSPERFMPQEGEVEGIERRMSGFFRFHPLQQRQSQSYSRPPSYPSIGSALEGPQTPTNSHAPDRVGNSHDDRPARQESSTVVLPQNTNMETRARVRQRRQAHLDDKCEGSHEPGANEHLPEVYSLAACCDCQSAYEDKEGKSFISVLIDILEEDPHPTWHNLMLKLKYTLFKNSQEMIEHYKKRKEKREKQKLREEKKRRKRRAQREKAGVSASTSASSSPSAGGSTGTTLSSSVTSASTLAASTSTMSMSMSSPVSISASASAYHDPHVQIDTTSKTISHSRTLSIPIPSTMHSRSHSLGGASMDVSTLADTETTPLPTPDASTSDYKFAYSSGGVFSVVNAGVGTEVDIHTPTSVGTPNLTLITENIKVETRYSMTGAFGMDSLREDEVDPDVLAQDGVQDEVLANFPIQDPVLGSMAPIDLKNRKFSL